jgi:hypothetical protein
MSYIFKYTEQNNERASEFETKTLLYLLGIDKDRSEISIAFIDCFNDVTGTDENCIALWDLQSKGVSNLTPRKIGTSLVTLYSNYSSEFNFRKYALFIPQPELTYINDSSFLEFGINKFGKYKAKIREGLVDEYIRRFKITNLSVEERSRLDSFLEDVVFIIDKGDKSDYVKNLVSFKDKDLKPKEFYVEIFNEIRSAQASKKAVSIHGRTINNIPEALEFKKHIRSSEITTLVINRLVGVELFNRIAIPPDFLTEVRELDKNEVKDLIQECNAKISRAIFDKNNKDDFWIFFENVILNLIKNARLSSREVYDIVSQSGVKRFGHLTGLSGVFLISLIKEGLEINENT